MRKKPVDGYLVWKNSLRCSECKHGKHEAGKCKGLREWPCPCHAAGAKETT